MVSDLSLIFTEMNRNNTSIYAVDPKGLAPFEYDINQGVGLQVDRKHLEMGLDTLRALADNTDGRAIVNRNDIGKAMQQIIRDASGYYLIGYNSSQAPTDGKFHKIDVEVTRKGVDVRARKGYWAYTAEDAARVEAPRAEAPPAVTAALATLVDPPRGRPARVWIGTSRGENGKSKVTFAWEAIPPLPGERRPGDEGVSHVTLTALAPDGRPLFRGRVPEQSAATATGPVTAASATFDVPPGRMQLRVTVQSAGGQVMDSSTSDVTVPDYTTPQVLFGTPRLFRARTPRDVQAIKANAAPVPSTDRTFTRTERLLVRVDAYAPGQRAAGRDRAAAEPRRDSDVRRARAGGQQRRGGDGAGVRVAGGGRIRPRAFGQGRGRRHPGNRRVQGEMSSSCLLPASGSQLSAAVEQRPTELVAE